jgi:hypothetical protein
MQPLLLLLKVFMSPERLPLEISCLRALELIARQVMRSVTRKSSRKTRKTRKAPELYHSLNVVILPGWNFPSVSHTFNNMGWLNYLFLLIILLTEQKSKSI